MNHSVLHTSLRAFFTALCAMIGVVVGIIPLLLISVWLVNQSDEGLEIRSFYSPAVLPNAQDERKVLSASAPVILKININGFIGTDQLNMHTVTQQLTEATEGVLKNNRVKAVLIHINSPGGTVVDADGIYRAITDFKARNEVPIYAYVDGLCASGGMYIAAACDKIYASDVSLVGSIGVVSPPFFNVHELMKTIGVESKTLHEGKGKDNLNPFRPWKKGEADNLQSLIESYYNLFVDIILKSRSKISREALVEEYGAKVFSSEKAMEIGLVDGAGYTLDASLKTLAKAIGIDDDYYQVVKMERKVTFADLFKRDSAMMTGTITHELKCLKGFEPQLMNQFLYLYVPGN